MLGRCVRSFLELRGVDRAVVLSSQAFTALIPLLLLVAALAPAGRRDVVSVGIIGRFGLSGDAADAVGRLFAQPGDSSISVLSVLLLLFSVVSLTRRLQRMYQDAWHLGPVRGPGRALDLALALTVLVIGISLQFLARSLVGALPAGDVLVPLLAALVSFLLWTSVPWLLLDRRTSWRTLVPAGALTAVCTTLYGLASTVYMPALLTSYSRRYGLFGVTLALIGWLLASALIVVAATSIAVEFDRATDPWARRIRRTLRITPGGRQDREAPGEDRRSAGWAAGEDREERGNGTPAAWAHGHAAAEGSAQRAHAQRTRE